MASRSNRVLTDRDEIRRWAEERKASPACVRGTGGKNDIGMLRLDFPGYSGAQSLEHIGWNDWLDKFDERGLALLVQDRTARGERSNFNKIVSRETAQATQSGRSRPRAKASARRRATKKAAAKRATRRLAATTASRASSAKRKSTARGSRRASTSSRASSARRTQSTRSAGTKQASSRAKTASSGTRAKSSRSKTSTSRKTQRSSASTRRRSASRNNVRSIESGRRGSKSHVLTDHDEIRRWAEERNAAPACVRGTGGGKDPGMIRLDFPGFSGARSLEHIGWDEWFRAFDDNKLALIVQDSRAGGGRSNFNKLIARETMEHRSRGENKFSRRHPEKAASSRMRAGSAHPSTKSTKKATRGSTRSHRTESVRGRSTSQRRAA